MKRYTILLLSLAACFTACGQNNDSLFSRLRGIANGGVVFFNVDGIEITSQLLSGAFSKKDIARQFRRYKIREEDLKAADSLLDLPNLYVTRSEELCPGTVQYTSYYFVESPGTGTRALTFVAINKKDPDFERHFVRLVAGSSIPRSVYDSPQMDSINFAGRRIAMAGSCRWMGINNVQCPSYGQMNWSVHQTLEDAANTVTNQYHVIGAKKQGKIPSDEMVDVLFEGREVKARKVVYDFKGVTSLLVGMSGGKTLTSYFVAAPVRQHYVSCVMSFWNNDSINPSGLPPLLEQVMHLKK